MKVMDYMQGIPGPRSIRRVVSIEFDSMQESEDFFYFFVEGKMTGSVLKISLTEKQRSFFSAISTPPG